MTDRNEVCEHCGSLKRIHCPHGEYRQAWEELEAKLGPNDALLSGRPRVIPVVVLKEWMQELRP